jgi:hypothetical protein
MIQLTSLGYLQMDDWNAILTRAIAVKKSIVASGGMATKSSVENVLMSEYAGLDRYNAHSVMNHIESRNLDL